MTQAMPALIAKSKSCRQRYDWCRRPQAGTQTERSEREHRCMDILDRCFEAEAGRVLGVEIEGLRHSGTRRFDIDIDFDIDFDIDKSISTSRHSAAPSARIATAAHDPSVLSLCTASEGMWGGGVGSPSQERGGGG